MHVFKRLWGKRLLVHGIRVARDEYQDAKEDIEHSSQSLRIGAYIFAAYLFLTIAFGIYWSLTPPLLNIKTTIQSFLLEQNLSSKSEMAAGVATTATLVAVTETLWKKPGGFITNDMLPPGVWLDDMPHWELGVTLQVRDTTQMLLSSLSQSIENRVLDDDLQKARVRLHFVNTSWIFPASESQYKAGVEHLQKYAVRLSQGEQSDAHFYNDAEHLQDYLAGVEQRLKNLSQRLTASVGPNINTDAAAMPVIQNDDNGWSNGLYTQTPWFQLDDVFYEARGSSWALIALLQGIEIDFSAVLKSKNAQSSYEQIIRELKPTQNVVYSPIILNGNGVGIVANHSLAMASYLARAQAAIADCRRLLLAQTP